MGDSLTSLQSTTFAASLQALVRRSQLFAQRCRKRLQSTSSVAVQFHRLKDDARTKQ